MGYLPQQKAQQEIAAVNDALLKAANAPTSGDLALSIFPLQRSLNSLEAIVQQIETKLQARFRDRVAEFRALAEGDAGIPAVRGRELAILARGREARGRE